jgi:hypothetical protein
MNDGDQLIAEMLDRAYPAAAAPGGDWEAVLESARSRSASWWARRLAVATLSVSAAVVLLAVFWPFESSGGGVFERALAAVGPGRVVHIRVRVHPQGTAVDLATGRRARVYAVIEQWYEPRVGLFQRVVRSNGGLEPGSLPLTRGVFPAYAAALQGFGSGYRDALHRKQARIASKGMLLGREVYWLRFRPTTHTPPYEVAVDAETYAPVFLRQTDASGSGSQILSVNTVSAVPRSVITAPAPSSTRTMFGIDRTGRLALGQASTFMSRPAFWLGDSHGDLPLEWVGGLIYSQGQVERWSQIKRHWQGLELVYGAINKFGFPDRAKEYLRIEEQTEPLGIPGSAPPEGIIVSYGRLGVMQKEGVYFYIEASSPDLVLPAARALTPMPLKEPN